MSYNSLSQDKKIEFMNSDLSFNPKKLTNFYNFPDKRPLSYMFSQDVLSTLSSTKNYVNFFPFKIVTLSFLESLGYVELVGGMILGAKWNEFYRLKLPATSKYLPMGDVLVSKDAATGKDVPIILVRNLPKYAMPIMLGDDNLFVGNTSECWRFNTDWRKVDPNESFKNNYVNVGNLMEAIGDEGTKGNIYNGRENGCIVAVNRDYVYRLTSEKSQNLYHADDRWLLGDSNGSGCARVKVGQYTSFFNTFNLMQEGQFSWSKPSGFYDFIPDIFKATCCSSLNSNQSVNNPVCKSLGNTSYTDLGTCDTFMFGNLEEFDEKKYMERINIINAVGGLGGSGSSTSYSNMKNYSTKYALEDEEDGFGSTPGGNTIVSEINFQDQYCKGSLLNNIMCGRFFDISYQNKINEGDRPTARKLQKKYELDSQIFCMSDDKNYTELPGLCTCLSKPENNIEEFKNKILTKVRDNYAIANAEKILEVLESEGVFENPIECFDINCYSDASQVAKKIDYKDIRDNKCENPSPLLDCIKQKGYNSSGQMLPSKINQCYLDLYPETTPPSGTTPKPVQTPAPGSTPKPSKNISATPTTPSTPTTPPSKEGDNTYLYIGIGVFVLIVIIAIVAYFMLKKPDQPMMMPQQPMMMPQQRIRN